MYKKSGIRPNILFSWCAVGFSLYAQAKQEESVQPQPFATQTILMLLDQSEPILGEQIDENNTLTTTRGPIMHELHQALLEEEAIIITSSYTINYLTRYLKEIDKYFLGGLSIKPEHWIKKKVSDTLYVLIPQHYITKRANYNALKKINTEKLTSYTTEELAVGIKLESMITIDDDEFIDPTSHMSREGEKEDHDFSSSFVQQLSNIFISTKEYNKIFSGRYKHKINYFLPQSAIIVSGHGGAHAQQEIPITTGKQTSTKYIYSGGAVAGLTSQDFGAVVSFLSKNLIVKLLFIITCFGSEINLQQALDSIENNAPLNKQLSSISFNFPIIGSAASSLFIRKEAKYNNNKTTLQSSYTYDDIVQVPNYRKFFSELNKSYASEAQIGEALQYIYIMGTRYNTIPLIKYKDLPWRVMNVPGGIIALDETLTSTRDNNKPLDLASFFKGDNKERVFPKILALKAHTIPFEIKLEKLPTVISVAPGNALHAIASINASRFTLAEIFSMFTPLDNELSKQSIEYKIFNIKKIIASYDELSSFSTARHNELLRDAFSDQENSDTTITITNVWCIQQPKESPLILFEYNNKFWSWNMEINDPEYGLRELPSKEFSNLIKELPHIQTKEAIDLSELKKLKFKKPKTEEEVQKETK